MLPSKLQAGNTCSFIYSGMLFKAKVKFVGGSFADVVIEDDRLGRRDLVLFDQYSSEYDLEVVS